jgi:hypothetical protein
MELPIAARGQGNERCLVAIVRSLEELQPLELILKKIAKPAESLAERKAHSQLGQLQ